MKNQIIEIIAKQPKNFSQTIKRRDELLQWVISNSLVQSTNFSEMIYSAINSVANVCQNGNIKKFSSFNAGYVGCGPANKCKCIRDQVSKKVSISKQAVSEEEQAVINDKRRLTNLEKYGVTCAAQSESAKQKHQDFYADPIKVQETLDKIKATYQSRYGVDNCRHLPESEQKRLATILTRYNVTNVSQIPGVKAKLRARIAEYVTNGHLLEKGYSKFSAYVESKYNFTLLTDMESYIEQKQKNSSSFEFKCNVCQSKVYKKFQYGRGLVCRICNPVVKSWLSKEEQSVYDYIVNELGIGNSEQSVRTLINPYEIDMIFHDQKIAIEYCGLYWHSELSFETPDYMLKGKDRNYHANKLQLVNEKGYRLITIFSDEWLLRNDVVKSKLRNIFSLTEKRYYARKLEVREVPVDNSKEFAEKYHMQGHSSAKINLGLYSFDKLVALMTFSHGRAALNSKSNQSEYELVRFVTDGSSVVGGASKLLSHFIKLYSPTLIFSYADLRWSEGNVYTTIGFKKVGKPVVGYYYVDDYTKRYYRFNFTKQTLVSEGANPKLTEWEIMQELGYDRIWDCGIQKYEMRIGNGI